MKKYIITIAFAFTAAVAWADNAPATDPAAAAVEVTDSAVQEVMEQERPKAPEVATDAVSAAWDAAATAYINGKFHEAVETYEALVAKGLSSYKLYYNLGNAYFKEDNMAKAIVNYHRALRLAPGEEDVRYNLSVAEGELKDQIERVPEFFLTEWFLAMRRSMSCTAWSIWSLAALIAGLALMLMYLMARRIVWRKTGFYGTLAAAVIFVVTTWFAAGERHSMLDRTDAVVMAQSVAVKSSPDLSATDLFILHAGTTLRINNSLDGWAEITIADGKKGWIEEHKIEVI